MLSYKQWKQLNESVFGSFPLGLSQTQSLGISSNVEGAEIEGVELEEGRKKKKVKVVEDETGDGEVVAPASKKDEPKSASCGCSKCGKNCKNMLSDEDDTDNEEDEDEDEDEEDTEDEDDTDEDEEEDDTDEDDEDEDEEDDTDEDEEDDTDEDEDEDEDKEKAPKMMKKKMKKEEREWLGSLLNQIGDPTQKFDSGFTEDNFSADQAGPGEVGYAPSGRIADNFTQVTEASEGLTAKQKKLPKALQDEILKKKGVKSDKDSDEKSEDSEEVSDKSDEDSDESSDKKSDEGSKGSVEKHLKAYLKKNPKASFKEAKDYVKKQKGMEKSKVTLKDYLVCKKKAK